MFHVEHQEGSGALSGAVSSNRLLEVESEGPLQLESAVKAIPASWNFILTQTGAGKMFHVEH